MGLMFGLPLSMNCCQLYTWYYAVQCMNLSSLYFLEGHAARHDIVRIMALLVIWLAESFPVSAHVRGGELQHPHELAPALL